eukprot:CAMPEP_0197076104 /NCGR_PEP_ID=MMETSP1384-20130603/211943_1 /TAXON_ID=29189 /ORGANISM="Ammonia sp." /LENGTH=811 /DNA_ID=CAMNT_0042514953 /DNA_START=39 /DNA_END=2474 /DNA_ORIENTATION=-
MSRWVQITNLPLYYDEYSLAEIFGDIGPISALKVSKNEMILKSTGFVQFRDAKHAKSAASKKDQTVIANSAVRVFLVWTQQEDLSTIKVTNIEADTTEAALKQHFDPYGGIVDITVVRNNKQQQTHNDDDEKVNEQHNESFAAFISFCKVEYAIQAVQEMNGTIIAMGGALQVELVNADARNLKWKRVSFEYTRVALPRAEEMNQLQSYSHGKARHHHGNNRHRDRYQNHYHNHQNSYHQDQSQQQYSTYNNDSNAKANIVIVNNIGSIHNNTNINDVTENTQNQNNGHSHNDNMLHPPNYARNQHKPRHRPHSLSPNATPRGRGRDRRYRSQHDDHRHRHYQHAYDDNNNRRVRDNYNQRDRKPRKYRSARSNDSTLLGPLYNASNGQYKTYSVTPSPTRADGDISPNHLHSLQRMNSSDSVSSNGSAQSLPNSYNHQQHKRRALDHYGIQSKQTQPLHSPQPYQPMAQTPVSPATTVSTPSTTHSMPTPTGYTNTTQTLLSASKTPTGLTIPTPTVLTHSTTTPVSTPPAASSLKYPLNGNAPIFAPQNGTINLPAFNPYALNMSQLTQGINAMNLNALNAQNNAAALNAMLSPTALHLPIQNMATTYPGSQSKSPQCTSPILLTPQTNKIIQSQLNALPKCTNMNAKTTPIIISPPNAPQQPVVFMSPSTLQGPINDTPPQIQKRFVFDQNGKNIKQTLTASKSVNGSHSNGNVGKSESGKSASTSTSQKKRKSGSHAWTAEQQRIGNELYKMVHAQYPECATKIVGMLLLGHSIDDLEFMKSRPNVLAPILRDYNQKQLQKQHSKKK